MWVITKEIDWVELGCRGWDIGEYGASLYKASEDRPFGDASVCCGTSDCCHLDNETMSLSLYGCPVFVQRVYDDLAASFYAGFRREWSTTVVEGFGGSVTEACWPTLNTTP